MYGTGISAAIRRLSKRSMDTRRRSGGEREGSDDDVESDDGHDDDVEGDDGYNDDVDVG